MGKKMPEVKTKDKLRWVTEETLKIVSGKREANAKGDKSRARILNSLFNSCHVEKQGIITMAT